MEDELKKIIELAGQNELGNKLIAYCARSAERAREDALIQQGRANAYAEMAALLEGRVRFNE